MARESGENRRASTIIRHNEVHRAYAELSARLGRHLINNIGKRYIYEEIGRRTGLCGKTVAYVLNHTEEVRDI